MPTQLLSSTQIATMQGAVARTLPDICSIQRYTSAPDGAGGQTESWSTVHSNVACRVTDYEGRKGGIEDVKEDRFDTVLWWRFTLPSGTDLTARDRLVWQSRAFEVVSAGSGRSNEVEAHAMAVEIT